MTDDPEKAQAAAEKCGLEVSWGTDPLGKERYMKTKFYISAFEYAPNMDRNIMYSSIADHHMWFDSWPGVQKLAPEDRPIKLTFGDLSELTYDEWKYWVDLQDKYGFPLVWEEGDAVVACNYRYAHGRPAIELGPGDKRNLGVTLGPTFDRIGDLPGKW